MKKCFSVVLFVLLAAIGFAQHKLEKIWETDSVLKVPESVLFDASEKLLFVSNIDGQPWGKDGVGSIGKVALDGKIIQVDWVTGLNAPKGMARHKNHLYVADLGNLVVIDIKKGTIVQQITIAGAEGLNDVTADSKGVIYVTDSKTKKVYKVENGVASVWLDQLKGPNGILMHNNTLFVLDAGGMYKVSEDKSLVKIADGMEGGTDGIEHVSNGDYIVSCWSGVVWYVKADGTKELLLDSRTEKINSADIGYDPKKRIVYVPTFFKKSVVAYKVL